MNSFELNGDDVVSMDADNSFTESKTSKIEDTIHAISELLKSESPLDKWMNGVDCEILLAKGGGWQRGKAKFSFCLEFIPEKPELPQPEHSFPIEPKSPLDDLRSNL